MDKKDILFWGILAVIALFYITFGNNVYDKKYEKIRNSEKVDTHNEENIKH